MLSDFSSPTGDISHDPFPPHPDDPYSKSYYADPWIETYTGRKIRLLASIEQLIPFLNHEDIAHSLAMQCRYCGHCEFFWSVASHSLLVADIMEYLVYLYGDGKPSSLDLKLAALLHDAHEAYLHDITSPFKTILCNIYNPIKQTFQDAIHQKYNILLNEEDNHFLSAADRMAKTFEAKYLMKSHGKGWEGELEIPKILHNNTHVKGPAPTIMPVRCYDIAYTKQMYLSALNQLIS